MSTTTRRIYLFLLLVALCMGRAAQAGAPVWTPVGPGAGYEVASVTVHPSAPGNVWAGLQQGGLYRSSDQGVNWRWVGGSPWDSDQGAISAVAADPSKPAALWAATRSGLFRTEDGGAHWARVSGEAWTALLGDENPEHLVAVPGTLYLQLRRQLLASPDGGGTWLVVHDLGDEGAIQSFAVHPAAPRFLYLAVLGPEGLRLLQSSDRGATWAAVTTLPELAWIETVAVAPAAVYVTVHGDQAGVLRSLDRGRTWRRVLGGTRARQFYGTLTIDPRTPRVLYASGFFPHDFTAETGFWISRNSGTTWTKVGTRNFSLVQIDSAAGVFYALQDADLLRSRDGGATWTVVLRVPNPESSFAQIAFRPGDPARRALAIGFTLYRSVNGGQSWKLASAPGDVRDVDVDPADSNRLIAITSSSAEFSENAGQTWQWASATFDYAELLVRADEQTLLVGGTGIFRSGDNGRTWATVLEGWPPGQDTGRRTQKIEVDPADPSTIYALTFLADVVEPPHDVLSDLPSILWKSTDGGRRWKKMTLNLRTFAVDPGTSRLYGVRQRHVLASDDGGRSWRAVGQTPRLVHELVIDPTDPNVFYAAGYGFWLSRSRDRGVTWELVSDAWTPLTLTFDPEDSRILYGADRWGVFKMTVPD